jgi:hypothetical protein
MEVLKRKALPSKHGSQIHDLPTSFEDPSNYEANHSPLLETKNNAGDPQKSTSADSHSIGQRPPILRSLMIEIFCLALATASLLGFVAILRKYDNRQSPEWTVGHFSVTLNAIISVVSTVFRGTLLMPVAQSISQLGWIWYTQPRSLQDICFYDSASRGPLGSIRLLFRLRFMYLETILLFI